MVWYNKLDGDVPCGVVLYLVGGCVLCGGGQVVCFSFAVYF